MESPPSAWQASQPFQLPSRCSVQYFRHVINDGRRGARAGRRGACVEGRHFGNERFLRNRAPQSAPVETHQLSLQFVPKSTPQLS